MMYYYPDGRVLATDISQFSINKYLMDDYKEARKDPNLRKETKIRSKTLKTEYIGYGGGSFKTTIAEVSFYSSNFIHAMRAHLIIRDYWKFFGLLPKSIRQFSNRVLYKKLIKVERN